MIIFAQDFYEKHLSTINSVRFTKREIDIIACLVNAKGAKATASLLGIKLSGVHSHLLNIRSKLECNSGASIVAFIEESGKLPATRQYFYLLQSRILFETYLKAIVKANPQKKDCCLYIQGNDNDSLLVHLKFHLELAGFSVSISRREKKADYTLFIMPRLLDETPFSAYLPKIIKSPNKVLLLLREEINSSEIHQEFKKWDIIDFSKPENYFFSFFTMLEKLMPQLNLRTIIANFTDKYTKTQQNYIPHPASLDATRQDSTSVFKKWGYYFSICLFFMLIGAGFLFISWNHKNHEAASLRSNLLIPKKSVLLERIPVLEKIDQALKQKKGIQTVALVGIGGSGKTTLARQYARQQKAPLIWEINAETKSSLIESFKNLACALAHTEEEKRILKSFQDIKNPAEREENLFIFVKERLRSYPGWLLIFDNVEKFATIQKHFPTDPVVLGEGKVIITTRDSNIVNNIFINGGIQVGELNQEQKLDLFIKILNSGNNHQFNTFQKEQIYKFLEAIPPFPLDISIAAYYIKTTNTSYDKYLDHINNNKEGFNLIQENLLNELGQYKKTRYNIITLSIKQIINAHKDFGDLLLFVGLLDSQNIPKDLLDFCKNDIVVDNFMNYLKKYSLIIYQPYNGLSYPLFSIHRSTQLIILEYLKNKFILEKKSEKLETFNNVLEMYVAKTIDQEDFLKMKLLVSHCEKFKNHQNILTLDMRNSFSVFLGGLYFYLGDYSKAQQILSDSLVGLKNCSHKPYSKIVQGLVFLGICYRELGDYKNAKDKLEESLHIYQTYLPDQHHEIARVLGYLGYVYRNLGSYEKAVNLIEQSLVIYKKSCSENYNILARNLGYLGVVYEEMGDFEKAKNQLEKSYNMYKKHLAEDHFRIGWSLSMLGKVHYQLGNYAIAQKLLQQSWEIYKRYFPENGIDVGYILHYLAKLNVKLGNYENAKQLFETVLKTFETSHGPTHVIVADIIRGLGECYLAQGEFNKAENYLRRSYDIFFINHHPKIHQTLESLSELHVLKANLILLRGDRKQFEALRAQAMNYLKQAEEIVKAHFPADSPHLVRISAALKKLEE